MIRSAQPADAAAIAALHGALFDEPWSAADVLGLVTGPTAVALLATGDAERGGARLDGFLIGRLVADEAEILTLGVSHARRGRGLARALCGAFADRVHGAGARRVFLEVAADNVAALALYRRLGFAATGVRRGYYPRLHAPAVDAQCMALEL